MTDEASEQSEQKEPELPADIPWLRATADDLLDFDFESLIVESKTADCSDLSDLFRQAMQAHADDSSEGRIFSLLWAITGMHFKPQDRNDPFGPMFRSANRRSAIPADFRGHIDLLENMAGRAIHPVLRARLADLCALLDRKRAKMGFVALSAYLEIIKRVDADELHFRSEETSSALSHQSVELLRRALQLGRILGWDKPETILAREMTTSLCFRANKSLMAVPAHRFNKLDLDYGVSNTNDVANGLEELITAIANSSDLDTVANLWRLAARAYHYAKLTDDYNRCRAEAGECVIKRAEGTGSAMLASHELSRAIAELHGIPGKKDRRRELLHKLIDVQSRISDEMKPIAHEMNLKDVILQVEKIFNEGDLKEKLFTLAIIDQIPEPDELVKDAIESIQQYPLSSLFGTSHHDSEGKVIHRSAGGGFGDSADESAVKQQVAQSESIRRNFVVPSKFEVARRAINNDYYLSEDIFSALFIHSPFVPNDLIFTFSRGFLRLFQGDFVSALYILTPLLENSLRYVLKSHGEDVTIFDDATQTQQDRTISSLFEQMRPQLDKIFTKAVTADIERVFLSKPGPYIRHALSHGLLRDGDPHSPDAIYACWIIFRLCLVPLYPYRDSIQLPE
jgi:hypothetical protein